MPQLRWAKKMRPKYDFNRSIMEYYDIKDLRELYENDINKLREMKFWDK